MRAAVLGAAEEDSNRQQTPPPPCFWVGVAEGEVTGGVFS
jgi:hypothetical protein